MKTSKLLSASFLLGFFFSSIAFAGHLFIYDFDQTLTKEHTFVKTKRGIDPKLDVRGEMKDSVGEALSAILKNGHHLAIATFHTRKDVVEHYLRSVLTEEETAQIEIAIRDGKRFGMTQVDNKDNYIVYLINSFVEKGFIVDGVTFYDDSWSNVDSFERFFAKSRKNIEGVRVSKDVENSDHFQHTLRKISRL